MNPKATSLRKSIKLITSIQTYQDKRGRRNRLQKKQEDAIMTESTVIKRIIKKLCKQCFANKSNNLS